MVLRKFSKEELSVMSSAELILHIDQLYQEIDKLAPKENKTKIHFNGSPKWVEDAYKAHMRATRSEK